MIYNGKVHDFTVMFGKDKMFLWIENLEHHETILRYMFKSWEDQGTTALVKIGEKETYVKHLSHNTEWIIVDEGNTTEENTTAIRDIKTQLNKYLTSKFEEAVFDE